MGRYVNPGNEGFAKITQSRYVDKTGLVATFNKTLDTVNGLVMVSRPRRFGKSYAVKMLTAFYSCGCDSRELFEGLAVANEPEWDEHLNAYNVITLDMTEVLQENAGLDAVESATSMILGELRQMVPNAGSSATGPGGVLTSAILDVVHETGRRFVFIIDEWDAPYRLVKNDNASQTRYAEWLRGLFKGNSFTPVAIAGAYLTGILPIKKFAHQSAVSDFDEFTMLDPGPYAPYAGFCDNEVSVLCEEYGLDTDEVQCWYDGYRLRFHKKTYDVYAPYSVMRACERGKVGSYWVSTESFESLREYIDMDFDGLQGDIVRAIGGEGLSVNTRKFQNDLESLHGKDDVLTLFVHLGYLYYDEASARVFVPNEEVRGELRSAVEESSHERVASIVRDSIQLVENVVAMDEEAVAAGIQRAHDETCAPLFYNNEQSLRSVVRAALIAAVDDWARIEELPGGHGVADIAYLPRHGSARPALLVELKWNKPAESAIKQVMDRNYPQVLQELGVPILLVGITYDAQTKEHVCRIERLEQR